MRNYDVLIFLVIIVHVVYLACEKFSYQEGSFHIHSFLALNDNCTKTGVIERSDPKVIKLCSCSTQLSTKFILLINVEMPTIVGILTFIA